MNMGAKIFILIFTACFINCHKSTSNKTDDRGCGCITDSIKHTYINADGLLTHNSLIDSWFIKTALGNGIYYVCRICNPELKEIKSITDTISGNTFVPVIFTGKIKEACPEELDSIVFLPEIIPCDISIDSIKKN